MSQDEYRLESIMSQSRTSDGREYASDFASPSCEDIGEVVARLGMANTSQRPKIPNVALDYVRLEGLPVSLARISVEARSGYDDLKYWLFKELAENHCLALTTIAIKRERSGERDLEMTVELHSTYELSRWLQSSRDSVVEK